MYIIVKYQSRKKDSAVSIDTNIIILYCLYLNIREYKKGKKKCKSKKYPMATPIMEKSLKATCTMWIKQSISMNWKHYPIIYFSFGLDDLVNRCGSICFSIIMTVTEKISLIPYSKIRLLDRIPQPIKINSDPCL